VFAEDADGTINRGSVIVGLRVNTASTHSRPQISCDRQSLDGPVAAADIAAAGGSYSGLLETSAAVSQFVRAGRRLLDRSVKSEMATSIGFFVSTTLRGLSGRVDWNEWRAVDSVLPVAAGGTFNDLCGRRGPGPDSRRAAISVSSPFITVNDSTVARNIRHALPLISFEITVDPYAPPGEYSIRLRPLMASLFISPAHSPSSLDQVARLLTRNSQGFITGKSLIPLSVRTIVLPVLKSNG